MKKNYILTLLFVLLFSFAYTQTTTFLSEKTKQPLTKVSVFGKDGSIMAYSDIDGKIDRKLLILHRKNFS